LYLTGQNFYAGGTTFTLAPGTNDDTAGVIIVGSSSVGGNTAAGTRTPITTGPLGRGTINVDAAATITEDTLNTNYTIANNVFLDPALTIDAQTGHTLTMPGQFTGTGGLIINNPNDPNTPTGTVILAGTYGNAGPNNYSGATDVEGGTLQAATNSGGNNAFSKNSDFVLTGGSTLDLNTNFE